MKLSKFFGFVASTIALIGIMALSTQAATVKVGQVTSSSATDEISVPVIVTDYTDGINGIAFRISYDATKLEPVKSETSDVTGGDLYASTTLDGILVADLTEENGTNYVSVGWAAQEAIVAESATDELTVATVNFVPTSSFTSGTTTIDIEVLQYADGSAVQDGTLSGEIAADAGWVTISTFVLGDINADGSVDITDISLIKAYIAGNQTFTDDQKSAANVVVTEDNDAIDITDASALIAFIAGNITEF